MPQHQPCRLSSPNITTDLTAISRPFSRFQGHLVLILCVQAKWFLLLSPRMEIFKLVESYLTKMVLKWQDTQLLEKNPICMRVLNTAAIILPLTHFTYFYNYYTHLLHLYTVFYCFIWRFIYLLLLREYYLPIYLVLSCSE